MGEHGRRGGRRAPPKPSAAEFSFDDDGADGAPGLPAPGARGLAGRAFDAARAVWDSPLYFTLLLLAIILLRIAWRIVRPPPGPDVAREQMAARYARLRVVADRGSQAAGAPRNSRMAIREAVRELSAGILLDVALAGGEAYVLDRAALPRLARAAGLPGPLQKKPADKWTPADLARLDLGQDERPPTLAEALDVLRGAAQETTLVLPAGPAEPLLDRIASILSTPRHASLARQIRLGIRDPAQLAAARTALPATPLALHADAPPSDFKPYAGITALHIPASCLAFALPAIPSGIALSVGPINTAPLMDLAVRLNVPTISTGMPGDVARAAGMLAQAFGGAQVQQGQQEVANGLAAQGEGAAPAAEDGPVDGMTGGAGEGGEGMDAGLEMGGGVWAQAATEADPTPAGPPKRKKKKGG